MAGNRRGAALAGRASQVRLRWEGWGVLGQSMQGCMLLASCLHGIPCQSTVQAAGRHNSGLSLWPSRCIPAPPAVTVVAATPAMCRLPVVEIREQLAAALQQQDVCVVSGETGSGKTTQVRVWIPGEAHPSFSSCHSSQIF